MDNARIIVVEDDSVYSDVLCKHLQQQGYKVEAVARNIEALSYLTRRYLPHLIILDTPLSARSVHLDPIFRELRTSTRTSHILMLLLCLPDEHDSEKMFPFFTVSDTENYFVKPFDLTKIEVMVQQLVDYAERTVIMDFIAPLPSLRLITEYFSNLLKDQDQNWTFIDLDLKNRYGFEESDEFRVSNALIRKLAMLLGEVIDEFGTTEDMVGLTGRANFHLITLSPQPNRLIAHLIGRLETDMKTPLLPIIMTAGIVWSMERHFEQPQEIIDLAVHRRERQAS